MIARSVARQILGTFVAIFAGWFAALVFIELMTAIELLQQPHYIVPEALIVTPIEFGFFMSFFIVPVWILILIPLYLFIPPASMLWRWPVCTACGAFAGFTLMGISFVALSGGDHFSSDVWEFFAIAAVVGGVTCLTGALTRRIFRLNKPGTPTPE